MKELIATSLSHSCNCMCDVLKCSPLFIIARKEVDDLQTFHSGNFNYLEKMYKFSC